MLVMVCTIFSFTSLFFPPELIFHSRVSGACPVTTDCILAMSLYEDKTITTSVDPLMPPLRENHFVHASFCLFGFIVTKFYDGESKIEKSFDKKTKKNLTKNGPAPHFLSRVPANSTCIVHTAVLTHLLLLHTTL